MRIKICGLFRNKDIEYINEVCPDFAGFVFAESKRQVSLPQAKQLRSLLAQNIVPVGVFVDAPIALIKALYGENIISIAQLHGGENEDYIYRLKEDAVGIQVIKTIRAKDIANKVHFISNADYFLFDSGAGSGKKFNWELLNSHNIEKPWFLAGGVNIDNIEQAMTYKPFALDISGGAETDGLKDREKIIQLVAAARKEFYE
jgi:phosphoribosylanthranilate isomerase